LFSRVRGSRHFGLIRLSVSPSDAELLEMSKYPVEISDPQNQYDHYDTIEDRFNLSLHWDKFIYKPQQKTCCNKRDQDSGKWHIVFSDRLPLFDPHPVSGPENRKRLVHLLSI
jgi:hypothetical protein